MSAKRDIGTPSDPVVPSGGQVPEPQLWPLLYDLNATVSRIDEAVSNLKDRVNSIDSRIEGVTDDLKDLTKEVSAARGSIKTLTWMLTLGVPIVLVILQMVLRHFKLI